jgi:hypothetical protein
MKLLVCLMLVAFVVATAVSAQAGGSTGKVLLLGSMNKGIVDQNNTLNQTNSTNSTNQTGTSVEINSQMRPVPAINKYKSATMPNNIQANTIAYQFTT